jgi:tRNA 2-thiouridine synthesizing protein E
VGRAAQALEAKAPPGDDRKARLAAILGPRRQLRAPAPGPAAPPAPARRSLPAPVGEWSREAAGTIAAAEGVTLTGEHWKVIEAARAEFEATKAAANIRRLTQITGLDTRGIYTLFPKAPGRTIARIAGTPKPVGCI